MKKTNLSYYHHYHQYIEFMRKNANKQKRLLYDTVMQHRRDGKRFWIRVDLIDVDKDAAYDFHVGYHATVRLVFCDANRNETEVSVVIKEPTTFLLYLFEQTKCSPVFYRNCMKDKKYSKLVFDSISGSLRHHFGHNHKNEHHVDEERMLPYLMDEDKRRQAEDNFWAF